MSSNPEKNPRSSQPIDLKLQILVFQFVLFPLRVIDSLYLQTFFQPDEYFQVLEPAWQLAFGSRSGAWITWEWKEHLRTSWHPYLFAGLYKAVDFVCQTFNFSHSIRASALLLAPKILQAFIAAQLDLAIWKAASRNYGQGSPASVAALVLTVFSPWNWFCSVRTFSNSLEATMTGIAIRFFPWYWFLEPSESDKKPPNVSILSNLSFSDFNWNYIRYLNSAAPDQLYPALAFAALSSYLRPTNIIIWISISVALIGCNRNYYKASILLQSAAYVGGVVAIISASLDRLYYGEWTFPPLRFVYFNVVKSLAGFYGQNRPDYYLTEGLPLLLTTALPFALAGIWQNLRSGTVTNAEEYIARQTRFVFSFTICVTVVAFSIIGHKEVRFIYPLLPMLLVLAAGPFASFFRPFPVPKTIWRRVVLTMLLTTNIYIAGYVGTRHQRGVVDVVHYLRERQEFGIKTASVSYGGDRPINTNVTVGFLMPCHSTPWRSHLIYPEIDAWALTCEPPVHLEADERAAYLDEADVFYSDPVQWLDTNMKDRLSISDAGSSKDSADLAHQMGKRKWPQYLVFFEQLEPILTEQLAGTTYKQCHRFFNTHWHDDWRRRGDVVVWCMDQEV